MGGQRGESQSRSYFAAKSHREGFAQGTKASSNRMDVVDGRASDVDGDGWWCAMMPCGQMGQLLNASDGMICRSSCTSWDSVRSSSTDSPDSLTASMLKRVSHRLITMMKLLDNLVS